MTDDRDCPSALEEQTQYAGVLEVGMRIGLLTLLVTFALYVSGVVSPAVPVDELPRYWVMSVHEYLEAVNHDHLHLEHPVDGWGWLSLLGRSDYLNFVGIAILSLITIVCYVRIVPTLLRKRDYVFSAIAVLEAAILTLAASGVLTVGH